MHLSIMNISLRSMKEKNSIRTKLRRLGLSLLKRESNYLDRQRQWLLVCFAVMLSLGILSNILGVSGAFDPFFTASNIVFLVVVVSSFAAYLLGKIGVVKGITFLAVATQVFIGMDILYSAFVPTLKDNTMVILINMLILAGNMFFSLAAYQARLTRWLVGIALGVYLVCVIVTGNESLRNYFFMMLLILLFISVLSLGIARNGEYLVNANKILQREEKELLQVLRINKKQIKAYVALAKERHDVKLNRSFKAAFLRFLRCSYPLQSIFSSLLSGMIGSGLTLLSRMTKVKKAVIPKNLSPVKRCSPTTLAKTSIECVPMPVT